MVAPFLKWAGGKGKLAPEIVARMPRTVRRYHEPFLGAGAVFFALRQAGCVRSARLSDANAALMECYAAIQDDVEGLIAALEPLARAYLGAEPGQRAEIYYEVRARVPEGAVERAARLIFLNRTCYNGLFRVNSQGQFNVPHGRYRKPRILDAERLRQASAALQGAELACEDFAQACARAGPGDLVYLDPPYQPLSETSRFTHYTKDEFGPDEQARLRDVFEELTRRGVAALLSNSAHDVVQELYADRGYTLVTVHMSRAINSVGSKRTPVAELLIGNMERPEVRARLESTAK